MKRIGWNENVFNLCMMLCIIYVMVYFKAYPGNNVNDTFASIEKVLKVFFALAPIVNFVCQIVALFQKRWKALLFIVVGLVVSLLSIGITWGQGV